MAENGAAAVERGTVAGAGGVPLATAAFVAAILAVAWLAGDATVAVYALSFWHYGLYLLAVAFAAVPLATFKRDAMLVKGIALAALFAVLASGSPSLLALTVVAAGFALNAAGAAALGTDRTYYGHEIAGLPHARITRFPYSVTAHPMLYGNMLAFGGTLLDAAFRRDWWPLAVLHVAANLGLIAMEGAAAVPDRRKSMAMALARVACHDSVVAIGFVVATGAVAGAALALLVGAGGVAVPAFAGACMAAYAIALCRCYRGDRRAVEAQRSAGELV